MQWSDDQYSRLETWHAYTEYRSPILHMLCVKASLHPVVKTGIHPGESVSVTIECKLDPTFCLFRNVLGCFINNVIVNVFLFTGPLPLISSFTAIFFLHMSDFSFIQPDKSNGHM